MRKNLLAKMCFVGGLLAVCNFSGWSLLNRSVKLKDWRDAALPSLSYAPYRADQNPIEGRFPTLEQMREDLVKLAPFIKSIRTYAVSNGQQDLPAVAKSLGLGILPGAWLDSQTDVNREEIKALIQMLRKNRGYIRRALVGNEVILRGEMSVDELITYIKQVQSKTGVKISTADVWQVWMNNPKLVDTVDFIAVHILPYWEGIAIEDAIQFVMDRYGSLREKYPNKPIFISEIGWPSEGPWVRAARPSLVNQASFVREFLQVAKAQNLDYSLMEAIDQPWKMEIEGPAGTSWGWLDSERNPKYELTGKVREFSDWSRYAAAAVLLGSLLLLAFTGSHQNLHSFGMFLYGGLLHLLSTALVWTALELTHRPFAPASAISWIFLMLANIGLMLVLLGDGLELVERIWLHRWRRRFTPLALPAGSRLSMVSIHVPTYNEPPAMVIATLRKLAQLTYPSFEVIVVDNNTKEELTWRPVEQECLRLGARFRFYHLPKWPGFKAGALNFALSQTDAKAEIIAVIDSDYLVAPDWLSAMSSFFDNDRVGFVQSPQDYYDWKGNLFKTACHHEYSGFFHIGMVQRNERNAIIQHGTMTMIRRTALVDSGGWGEWCITEDSELGLRLFQRGWESVYCSQSFGQGQIPDTFHDYRTQRFRWAYGAMQILKRHRHALFSRAGGLTFAQQFHFLAGWLPWLSDALHLTFTAASILWSTGLLSESEFFGFPPAVLVLPAMLAFMFKLLMHILLFRKIIGASRREVLGAAIAGMALSYTVGRAIWVGLFTSGRPFVRTPKWGMRDSWLKAVLVARDETILAATLWGLATAVLVVFSPYNGEAALWSAMLFIQSLPFTAALVMSLMDALGKDTVDSGHLTGVSFSVS